MAVHFPALVASLIANWVASENLTGLAGEAACAHAVPAILFDPIGPAVCLVLLGCALSSHVGTHKSMSSLVVARYGAWVGGVAAFLSVAGSVCWAAAQYRAIVQFTGLFLPHWAIDGTVVSVLLVWSQVGGLQADILLDGVSMCVIAPVTVFVGCFAASSLSSSAIRDEVRHASVALWSPVAADKITSGTFGHFFTEELAQRVLIAGTPALARQACMLAAAIFAVFGLVPAALGIWVRATGRMTGEMCEEGKDAALSIALTSLLGTHVSSAVTVLLILESANTLDTSVLAVGQVISDLLDQQFPALQGHFARISTGAALALIVFVGHAGTSVWDLAEQSVELVGAPLALIGLAACCGLKNVGGVVAGLGVSQATYLAAAHAESRIPFFLAVLTGWLACASACALRPQE